MEKVTITYKEIDYSATVLNKYNGFVTLEIDKPFGDITKILCLHSNSKLWKSK